MSSAFRKVTVTTSKTLCSLRGRGRLVQMWRETVGERAICSTTQSEQQNPFCYPRHPPSGVMSRCLAKVRATGGPEEESKNDGARSCVTSQGAAVVGDLEIERAWKCVSSTSEGFLTQLFACVTGGAAIGRKRVLITSGGGGGRRREGGGLEPIITLCESVDEQNKSSTHAHTVFVRWAGTSRPSTFRRGRRRRDLRGH